MEWSGELAKGNHQGMQCAITLEEKILTPIIENGSFYYQYICHEYCQKKAALSLNSDQNLLNHGQ